MTQEFDCRNIGTWGRSKLVGKEIFLPDWEAFVTLLTSRKRGKRRFFRHENFFANNTFIAHKIQKNIKLLFRSNPYNSL